MPPTPQLTIDPELRDLLSPLSPVQYEKLESEILRDGCMTPLTLWGDVIVDGHNRYAICSEHDIEFQTVQKEFPSINDAKLWMWTHQDGRRSLTRFGRVEFALKIKDVIASRSKERQGKRNDLKDNFVQNSAQSKRTRQQLAEFAKVSHDTVDRVEFILKHADESTINKLRWDETTINKEFNRVKAEQDAKFPPKPKTPKKQAASKTEDSVKIVSETQKATTSKSVEVKPEPTETSVEKAKSPGRKNETKTSSQTGRFCRPGEKPGDTGAPYVSRSSLTDLPHDQPEILVAQLIAHFPRAYVRECPFLILDALLANDGNETTNPIIQKIVDELLS